MISATFAAVSVIILNSGGSLAGDSASSLSRTLIVSSDARQQQSFSFDPYAITDIAVYISDAFAFPTESAILSPPSVNTQASATMPVEGWVLSSPNVTNDSFTFDPFAILATGGSLSGDAASGLSKTFVVSSDTTEQKSFSAVTLIEKGTTGVSESNSTLQPVPLVFASSGSRAAASFTPASISVVLGHIPIINQAAFEGDVTFSSTFSGTGFHTGVVQSDIVFANIFTGSAAFGGQCQSGIIFSGSSVGSCAFGGQCEAGIIFSGSTIGNITYSAACEGDILFGCLCVGSAIFGGHCESDIVFACLFIGPGNGAGIICLTGDGTPVGSRTGPPISRNGNYVF